MQANVKQPAFEIEPLEERIAPSAMTMGTDSTTNTGGGGGGPTQNVFFVGYDPAPGQNGNVGPYHVFGY